jgi:hypothetical protein
MKADVEYVSATRRIACSTAVCETRSQRSMLNLDLIFETHPDYRWSENGNRSKLAANHTNIFVAIL